MFAGFAVAAVGVFVALLFAGQIGMCLGPLGVTAVRCANATGMLPTTGAWQPMLLGAIALGLLVALPIRFSRVHAVAGGAGLVVGSATYLLSRPTLLEGPDYDGTWLSIPLPIEPGTLVAWAIAGLLVGVATTAILTGLSIRRRSLRGA
jgi:hypothetical protein